MNTPSEIEIWLPTKGGYKKYENVYKLVISDSYNGKALELS
jgi:hypothetical protein